MPERDAIHSSDVSTISSRSALVSTRSGKYDPVPMMAAWRVIAGEVSPRKVGFGCRVKAAVGERPDSLHVLGRAEKYGRSLGVRDRARDTARQVAVDGLDSDPDGIGYGSCA